MIRPRLLGPSLTTAPVWPAATAPVVRTAAARTRTAARAGRGAGADRVGAGRRPRGTRQIFGDRSAGRNGQDGAARGGADRREGGRNARATLAWDRAGARIRFRSCASALRAAAR